MIGERRPEVGRRRYVLGIASLVLSVCSGALLFFLVVIASVLTMVTVSPAAGVDAPGLGVTLAT